MHSSEIELTGINATVTAHVFVLRSRSPDITALSTKSSLGTGTTHAYPSLPEDMHTKQRQLHLKLYFKVNVKQFKTMLSHLVINLTELLLNKPFILLTSTISHSNTLNPNK